MLIGALPAILVLLVFLGAWAWLATQSLGIAEWLTGFAASWPEGWRVALQYFVAAAVVLAAGVVGVLSYTAVTILVGAPAYEAISRAVEAECGGISNPVSTSLAAQFAAAFRNGVRLIAKALGLAFLVALIGVIPVVGTVCSWLIATIGGGQLMVTELVGPASDARGFSLDRRTALLRQSRARALGLGVSAYLLFLIPFGAVVVMPAAIAGATRMLRDLNGEPV